MWVFWLWTKEAFKGIFRNPLMNSFAFLLSVVCFGAFAFFMIVGINAKYISSSQEEKVSIVLYLKDEVTNYQEIEQRINKIEGIDSYLFVSKDEAYKEMENLLGDRKKMLTELGFNPLPASFEIKLDNARDINTIVKKIQTWGVDKNIKYGEEYIDNFFNVTDKINQLAYSIVILMSFCTGAVIFSSIRMNIFNRNKELEIKNLIGAGVLNIRIPFILEATMLTVLSATFILILTLSFYDDLTQLVTQGLPLTQFMPKAEVMEYIATPLYFTAISIGVTSSLLSTQRYLKRH